MLAGARVLILDEPTKVLAPQETEGLFRTVAELRDEGYGIIFITHKLREVTACADRVAVMRQGRVVGTRPRSEASEATLLGLMFGDPSVAAARPVAPKSALGKTVLALDGIVTAPGQGATALRDLSLDLRSGEILGIAGVSGRQSHVWLRTDRGWRIAAAHVSLLMPPSQAMPAPSSPPRP